MEHINIAPTKESDERLANLLPVLQDFVSCDNEEIDINRDHAFLIGFISYANDDSADSTMVYSVIPSLIGKEINNLEQAVKIAGLLALITQRTGRELFEIMENSIKAAKITESITKRMVSEVQ